MANQALYRTPFAPPRAGGEREAPASRRKIHVEAAVGRIGCFAIIAAPAGRFGRPVRRFQSPDLAARQSVGASPARVLVYRFQCEYFLHARFAVRAESMMTRLPAAVCRGQQALAVLLAVAATLGCGTTRWTDTSRTATEQLLVSDAVDRAVDAIDFGVLAGQSVFLDTEHIDGITDQGYVIGSLRQKLLASGCVLKADRKDAKYVVEPRIGAVGTDRHELLYGVPATNIGSVMSLPGVPSSVPEIPIVKRTDQIGVAKISVFAYVQETGAPVWQSGVARQTSSAKDFWVLGAGPFQKGTIYDGTAFAGQDLSDSLVGLSTEASPPRQNASISQRALLGPRPTALASQPGPTQTPPDDPASDNPQAAMYLSALPQPAASAPPVQPPAAAAPGPAGFIPPPAYDPGAAYGPAPASPLAPGGYSQPRSDRMTPGARW